jgi:RNA polymerase sigma-70 factor (ECF subfamily)
LARSTASHEASEAVAALSVDVVRALGQLSLSHRQVVILHDLLDVPVAEVARDLNIPEGTVKSRLARARTALAPLLREDADHA